MPPQSERPGPQWASFKLRGRKKTLRNHGDENHGGCQRCASVWTRLESLRSLPEAWEDDVEGLEELLHGFFCLVPHITDAEGGPLDLAVAAVDEEVVLLAEGLDEAREVEVVRRGEADE